MSTAAPPGPAALPAPLRPWAVTAAGVALVFAFLTVRYAGDTAGGRADMRLAAAFDPLRMFGRLMVLGSPTVVVVLALATSVVCLRLGRRRLALLAVVGPGLTGLATTLLKPAIDRTLDGSPAYPSGHTGGATALGLLGALVLISLLRPGRAVGLALLAGGPRSSGAPSGRP